MCDEAIQLLGGVGIALLKLVPDENRGVRAEEVFARKQPLPPWHDGLVRVGVQSAVAHPEAGLLLRKLMVAQGMEAPPMNRTLASVCITEICDDVQ